jgi:Na+/H+ antiporter NhaA
MALFIAGMATSGYVLETVKLSVLIGSAAAGIAGWITLTRSPRRSAAYADEMA